MSSSKQLLQSNGFSLGLPDGWRDATTVVMVASEHPIFTPNIQITRIPRGDEPIDKMVADERAQLAQLPYFRLLSHGNSVLGEKPAIEHEFSWELPEQAGVRIRQWQVTSVVDDEVFTVTCSALEDEWQQAVIQFQDSLAQFRWEDS